MGFFNDVFGIGGSTKPRVTEKEYKKAKGELYAEGLVKEKEQK